MHMAATLAVPGVLLLAGAAIRFWRGRHCADRWHRSIWGADWCPSCGQSGLDVHDVVDALDDVDIDFD